MSKFFKRGLTRFKTLIQAFPRKSVPIVGGDVNDFRSIIGGYWVYPDNY